jgi:general secretion pathway protein F
MPVFKYEGFDAGGKALSGLVDADSAKVARTRLRKQGVFPTEVREQTEAARSGSGLNVQIDLSKYLQRISQSDIAQMTTQLSVLIGASIPMVEALNALTDQTEKPKLKVILTQVKEKVNEGAPLADAISEHPGVFENLYVQMVRAGERSGALDEVLRRLASYTDSQMKTQGKVLSALLYPILMSMVGLLILTGLFIGVIPRIRDLFDSLGGQDSLPFLTKIVFGIGDLVMHWYSPIVIGLVGAAVWYGFRRWLATPQGRWRFDLFKLRMPVFGRINRLLAVSRFSRTLGTLLTAGVPILQALEISKNVVGNVVIADAVQKAAGNIQEGQSIAPPLRASGQFPAMVTHMIATGEKTGDLEKMLNVVADTYDNEVSVQLEALTSLLGPLVILAMGGTVFLVALSLLLPMMNISRMIH